MKKTFVILLLLTIGAVVFAQNNKTYPQYTCPTGINPSEKTPSNSSNSSSQKYTVKTTESNYKCVSTSAKVAGNGVEVQTCTRENSDGSKTIKTTTCKGAGAKVNAAGVFDVGVEANNCNEKTTTLTPVR